MTQGKENVVNSYELVVDYNQEIGSLAKEHKLIENCVSVEYMSWIANICKGKINHIRVNHNVNDSLEPKLCHRC